MSNIKSSKKRILLNKYRKFINNSNKSMLKTYINKLKLLIKKKNKKSSLLIYYKVQSILDKLSVKKIIHFNKSSRYKSKLLKLINNI